jgi:hypothetical protein
VALANASRPLPDTDTCLHLHNDYSCEFVTARTVRRAGWARQARPA